MSEIISNTIEINPDVPLSTKESLIQKLKNKIGGSPFVGKNIFRDEKKSKHLMITIVLLAVIGGGLYLYMNNFIKRKMNENHKEDKSKKEKPKEEKKQKNLFVRVKEQIVKM